MMNCQSAGSYPGSHAGECPATIVIIFPTGMQEAACGDCARYWINLRPHQTRLAPLSSYVDCYEQAKAQLAAEQAQAEAERQSLEALRAAYASCPEHVLRRALEVAILVAKECRDEDSEREYLAILDRLERA